MAFRFVDLLYRYNGGCPHLIEDFRSVLLVRLLSVVGTKKSRTSLKFDSPTIIIGSLYELFVHK